MAAGDQYFDCDNKNLALDQVLRMTFKEDPETGFPCFTTNEASVLEGYVRDEHPERKWMTAEQILRMAIVQDETGQPILNVRND